MINAKIVDAQSMGASFDGPVIDIGGVMGYYVQAVYTGTPSGTLKMRSSADDVQDDSQVVNWEDVPGVTVTPAGAGGSASWNQHGFHARWIKMVWTRTGGTGTCTVTICGKA